MTKQTDKKQQDKKGKKELQVMTPKFRLSWPELFEAR